MPMPTDEPQGVAPAASPDDTSRTAEVAVAATGSPAVTWEAPDASEPPGPRPDARAMGRGRLARRDTHPVIWLPAAVIAAAMLIPAVYLVIAAAELDGGRILDIVTAAETRRLAGRTLLLGSSVTFASVLLGVPLAWLTVRSDLPARRFFAIAVALPLVIPTYVGAFTLIGAFARGGLIEDWFGIVPPSPYGFWGAFTALTLFSFPYVLITVQSGLRGLDPSLEEASRLLGHGPVRTFLKVTVPQLRASTAAGALLVLLYVFSDFGAVSMLRYSTFTRGLYIQYRSAFDRAPAALLGLLLVAMTIAVIVAEARLARDRGGQFRSRGPTRPAPRVALGAWRWPAAAACSVVVALGLVTPVTVVVYWMVRGLAAGEQVNLAFGAAGRSLLAAGLGALVGVLAALPVAIWSSRSSSRWARLIERASFTGYALPGIVVAFALVFVGIRVATPLYQTLAMLVFAYVVLFLPQAIGAIRSSLLQVTPDVEAASRSLGRSRLATLQRVTLPLARRGALAGGALVFLTALKELPATLLLAPTGYDTLATRVWSATSEAFYTRASVPALWLIMLGSIPLAVLMVRERREIDRS
ncbi:MAG: iron ABC transporter permease [Nitriliruptoraceae bacterium]|nr:iron ABC transporter permease [Nitriliruptoraceae bacterium]